jgi:hypothetical protein
LQIVTEQRWFAAIHAGIVRMGDDLYVRSVRGHTSDWFRGVYTRHEGHIHAGGVDKDVTFVEVSDTNINNQIDAAYTAKYPVIRPEL